MLKYQKYKHLNGSVYIYHVHIWNRYVNNADIIIVDRDNNEIRTTKSLGDYSMFWTATLSKNINETLKVYYGLLYLFKFNKLYSLYNRNLVRNSSTRFIPSIL